jgi:hypothetical protein
MFTYFIIVRGDDLFVSIRDVKMSATLLKSVWFKRKGGEVRGEEGRYFN